MKTLTINETLEPKFDFDSFANKLELLTKYYEYADEDFVNGLEQYCTVIRKGFARSGYYKKGYSLDNQWPIASFYKIFDPLLTRLFPEYSIGWIEFALAQIQLPLAHHLSKDKLYTVAEKLKLIESNLESHATEYDQISKQFIKEASTIGLLANTLYCLHNNAPKDILIWCDCCWRRAHKTSIYCLIHKPISSVNNNNNKMGKKLFNEISSEFNLEQDLSKVRSIRAVFNGNVKIITHEDEVIIESIPNMFYIRTHESTKTLVDSTINNDWNSGVSKIWDDELENEFPSIDAILIRKPSSFSNWSEFINSIRYALNEEVENCPHPYWFLCELSIAERWIRYENYSTNPYKIREIVLAYSTEGLNVKEISEKVGLKKSRIYEIIKYAKK